MAKKNKFVGLIHYFSKNLFVIIGIVLMWRGVWVLLDLVDESLGMDFRWITAPVGILVGILILYLPDKDLDEIKKL